MNYNWQPYAVGGATRPDSFSSMTPPMQQGLYGLLQAADQELGGGLQVYSGYRSPELQATLYENALQKYGSPEAARKWVAPPGRSKHNSGQAADLKYNGTRIDKLPEDHPARAWLSENVGRFGLAQPMDWEPWQVEVAGARSGNPAPDWGDIPKPPEQQAPLVYDFGIDAPTEKQERIQGLAQIAAQMAAPPPAKQLSRPQPQALQFEQASNPYMDFFKGMNNGSF